MNCIGFPKMFKGNSTIIKTDDYREEKKLRADNIGFDTVFHRNEATRECLYLLLNSERRDMFGDPDFGVFLKKYTFNQNNYILRDILIDELYTQISTFCPQVYIDRKNIEIKQKGKYLYASITYKNKKDYTTNTCDLVLTSLGDEE